MKHYIYYAIAIICVIIASVFLSQGIDKLYDSKESKDYLEQVGAYDENDLVTRTSAIENMRKKGELHIVASLVLFFMSAFGIGYSYAAEWKEKYFSLRQNYVLPINDEDSIPRKKEDTNKRSNADQSELINLRAEAEKAVLKRLKDRVIEYTNYKVDTLWTSNLASMGDQFPQEALIPLRKNLKEKGYYRNGDYHFCQFLYAGKYPSDNLDAYFSRNFNQSCNMAFKRLLPEGVDKIKQDLILLSDYYLQELHVHISKNYLILKLREAELLYNIEAQKADEREEAKAQKEFERAIRKAEKDKQQALERLEQERKALAEAKTEKERIKMQEHIDQLEAKLKEAMERYQRSVSMAQLTRSGIVYIISNVGSFGEGVYKIGMTRRSVPMERVIELGDASVPFPFNVHAFIYSNDAPSLENQLHQRFADRRVNDLNFRKEFFRVELSEIKDALIDMGIDVELSDMENTEIQNPFNVDILSKKDLLQNNDDIKTV